MDSESSNNWVSNTCEQVGSEVGSSIGEAVGDHFFTTTTTGPPVFLAAVQFAYVLSTRDAPGWYPGPKTTRQHLRPSKA